MAAGHIKAAWLRGEARAVRGFHGSEDQETSQPDAIRHREPTVRKA